MKSICLWFIVVVSVLDVLVFLVQAALYDKENFNAKDIGLPHTGRLAAFGDFNSDKSADVFVINTKAAGSSVTIYIWHSDNNEFQLLDNVEISDTRGILNIAPADFNFDGMLDLLVSGEDVDADETYINIYLGNLDSFETEPLVLPSAVRGHQVTIMDADNDLLPDLYGYYKNSEGMGERSFWVNQHLNTQSGTGEELFKIVPHDLTGTTALPKLASPHSNAFIDLNGDCLADFVITSVDDKGNRLLEIWLNVYNEKTSTGVTQFEYNKANSYSLPEGAGQITYSDYDSDGAIDILFPIRSQILGDSLHIFYNQQKPICSSHKASLNSCRSSTALCTADNNFKFANITDANSNDNMPTTYYSSHVRVELGQETLAAEIQHLPLTVRAGDIDNDLYVDLLLPVHGDSSDDREMVQLWGSVVCSVPMCTTEATEDNRRTFMKYTVNDDVIGDISKVDNVNGGVFFDVGNDGVLDVLLLSPSPVSLGDTSTYDGGTTILINKLEADALFLTTLASNGVCDAWCPEPQKTFPDPKPYGVNTHGVTYKFTVSTLNGEEQGIVGGQLPQSAFSPLGLPYNLFGLGRTNNYIETFTVGFTCGQTARQFLALIPNSQIVIFPYPTTDNTDWTLELFVNPSEQIVYIAICFFSVLAALALTIVGLHMQEKRGAERIKAEKGAGGDVGLYAFR